MKRCDYWDRRYAERGEFGTVGRPNETAHDYYRNAAEIAAIVGPMLPATMRRVLDFGCGTGRMVPLLMSRSREYLGVDISARAVETARARYGCDTIRFAWLGDDPDAVPVGRYDAALSVTVMQHIVSDEQLIGILTDIAKQLDGPLVALEATGDSTPTHGHIRFRSADDWHALFHAAGMDLSASAIERDERYLLMRATRR